VFKNVRITKAGKTFELWFDGENGSCDVEYMEQFSSKGMSVSMDSYTIMFSG
jgi:hypothetical protein